MNKKNIGVIILIVVLIVLAGYLYSGVTKCKAAAADLGTKLQECGTGLNQCMASAQTCQDVLTALNQVPACAPYIPTQ